MSRCPTKHKGRYRSLGDARDAAAKQTQRWGTATRAYRCECGRYHLTTWTVEDYRGKA